MMTAHPVPLAVWLLAAVVVSLPALARGREGGSTPLHLILLLLAATAGRAPAAYGLVALGTVLHAWDARHAGRSAWATLAAAGLATAAAGAAIAGGGAAAGFLLSTLAIALRAGCVPLHAGLATLSERAAHRYTEVLGSNVVAVFVHARFADDIAFAHAIAPAIVLLGAAMTLLPGLVALVQPDLRQFLRSAAVMHGGMVVAAIGASGRGHAAAAVMVVVTTALAVGGLALLVQALEARAGTVRLDGGPGGRVQAFPRLAAGFAIFGAAGVAMPGTAGFIADDLMLHALWSESVPATVMIILGAAALAIATLRAYAAAFLGPRRPTPAPDLLPRERAVTVLLLLLLLALGLVPGALLAPVDAFLSSGTPA